MEQINCVAFYNLGSTLRDCYAHARLPVKNWVFSAQSARDQLKAMLEGDIKFKLDESHDAATRMHGALDILVKAHAANGEVVQTNAEVDMYNATWWRFGEALALELGRAPTFYVTPKSVYSTQRLISDAAAVFEGFRDRLPNDAIADTNQAGRCLAFELPTAAGFHIARATEATIKRYMDAYGCAPFKESQRNWGTYIKALDEEGADAKITHHLTQLKDLHRNPVTHPEVTLTMPEAIALWALCTSVMQAMVGDIERRSATPKPEITAMAPPQENIPQPDFQ